jgi:molecular chaperone DnaJ
LPSHYEILDVYFGADEETIKQAYKKLAKKHHPDLNPGDETATARFVQVTEAYNALMSEFPGYKPVPLATSSKKKAVTLRRKVSLTVAELLSGAVVALDGVSGICPTCRGTGQRKINHLVDCLACKGLGYSYHEKGIIRLKIQCVPCGGKGRCDFMPCEDCRGYGATPRSNGSLSVPAGTLPGSTIIVKGGATDPASGITGDLEVLIEGKEMDVFAVDGLDIVHRRSLPIWDFVLGAKIAVPLPKGGTVSLTVPPNTSVGKEFRLPDNGFDDEDRNRGAYVVQLQLKDMNGNDPKVRSAFEALKATLSR